VSGVELKEWPRQAQCVETEIALRVGIVAWALQPAVEGGPRSYCACALQFFLEAWKQLRQRIPTAGQEYMRVSRLRCAWARLRPFRQRVAIKNSDGFKMPRERFCGHETGHASANNDGLPPCRSCHDSSSSPHKIAWALSVHSSGSLNGTGKAAISEHVCRELSGLGRDALAASQTSTTALQNRPLSTDE
jgi:hypothetical protein